MQYRNAKHISDGRIDCELEHPTYGWIPYTLDPSDTDTTVDNTDLLTAMLENGDVADYIPPTQEDIYLASCSGVRDRRGVLLVASDWTQVADATVDQAAWAAYRQALRDVPQQAGFPENVVWPTAPN